MRTGAFRLSKAGPLCGVQDGPEAVKMNNRFSSRLVDHAYKQRHIIRAGNDEQKGAVHDEIHLIVGGAAAPTPKLKIV